MIIHEYENGCWLSALEIIEDIRLGGYVEAPFFVVIMFFWLTIRFGFRSCTTDDLVKKLSGEG